MHIEIPLCLNLLSVYYKIERKFSFPLSSVVVVIVRRKREREK